jgi:hypothetical protein
MTCTASSGPFLTPPWANHRVNSLQNSWQISKRIPIVSSATISHYNSLSRFHSRQEGTATMVHHYASQFPIYYANLSTGTKVLRKTVLLVISIRQNLVGYTNNSFPLAILPNLLIMFLTSLMRTRAGRSISRSSSAHSVSLAEAV